MLDGEWNGVIGELSKKHADIGLGDFSVTEKRSNHSMLGLDATPKKRWMGFDFKFKKISIKQAFFINEIFSSRVKAPKQKKFKFFSLFFLCFFSVFACFSAFFKI